MNHACQHLPVAANPQEGVERVELVARNQVAAEETQGFGVSDEDPVPSKVASALCVGSQYS